MIDEALTDRSGHFEDIVKQLRALVDDTVSREVERHNAVSQAATMLSADEMAGLIIGARRVRNQHFGHRLFGEPAWDILLGLFVAHQRGQAVSVSAAITFGETSPTTGLRWLTALEREGLVERTGDPLDMRRHYVGLSSDGVAKIDRYVKEFARWVATKATLRKL